MLELGSLGPMTLGRSRHRGQVLRIHGLLGVARDPLSLRLARRLGAHLRHSAHLLII
jgi:hypothetical protein